MGVTSGDSFNIPGTGNFSGAFSVTVTNGMGFGGYGNALRTGTLTFSNGSSVSAAFLIFGSSNPTPGNGNTIDMTSGGTLTLGGSITVNNAVTNTWTPGTGTVVLNATNTLPSSVFTSFNNLTIGAGTTTLGTGVSITGAVNLTGTTIAGASTVTLGAGGNINTNIRTNTAMISTPTSVATARTITVANGAADPDLNISSVISGVGGISTAGPGVLQLSGSNTFTGGVTINSGTLRLNNNGALNSGSPNALTFGSGSTGILQLNGNSVSISSLNTNATVGSPIIENGVAGTNTLTVNNSTSDTYAGVLQNGSAGTLAITKSGTGSLALSGNNTYSGTTTLSAGTLDINSATALGTGTFTISGGTIDNTSAGAITLSNNNAQNWNSDFTFTGTHNLNLGTGGVTLSANRQVTVTANTLTVGGIISNASFNLTKAGAGTLSFGSNAVTLNGISLNSGTLTSTSGKLSLAGDF